MQVFVHGFFSIRGITMHYVRIVTVYVYASVRERVLFSIGTVAVCIHLEYGTLPCVNDPHGCTCVYVCHVISVRACVPSWTHARTWDAICACTDVFFYQCMSFSYIYVSRMWGEYFRVQAPHLDDMGHMMDMCTRIQKKWASLSYVGTHSSMCFSMDASSII